MATMTSRLLVSLIDGVSAPARKASQGLLGIPRAVRQANGQMTSFTQRLDTAISRNTASLDRARGRMMDAVAGYYLLTRAIGGPIKAAMRFEEAMADVKKVVDFPTPQAFKDFQKELLDMSKTIPVSVDGLAQIAAAAGQNGIPLDQITKFTEAAAKIGVAFDISANEAGTAIAKLMTGLGIGLDEAVKLSDAMNHLSNNQASKASEILDVVRRVGAQGTMFGYTAEDTAAFASAMIAAGAESEVAATSFRNMGKALTIGEAATKRQDAAFGKLGMSSTKVAKAMQKDAVATTMLVLEALAQVPEEQRAAISSQLFGDEARALGPLLTNLDLVKKSVGLVADESAYAGSAFREFEIRSKTLTGKLETFLNRLRSIGIEIGNALIPILSELMDRLTPVIEWASSFISQNAEVVAGLIAIAAGVVALKIALVSLSYLGLMGRGGVLGALSVGAKMLGGTVGYLWGAARASVALQAALGAMAGGQTLGILGKIAVGARGMLFAVPGVSMLAAGISAIGAGVAAISAPVWAAFAAIAAAVAAAGYSVWKYWDRITSVMSGVGAAIGDILAPAIEAIRPALDWLAPIGDMIAKGWQSAKDVIASVGEWLSAFFSREVLSDEDKAKYHDAGYDAIMALWDGMKQVMADLLSWVSEKAAMLASPFVKLGGVIKGALSDSGINTTGGVDEFSGVDGTRAKGGPMSAGRSYLVGEQGPEVVTPSKGGYVHPNGSKPGGSSGGGIVVSPVFNFNGTPKETADQIAVRVMDKIERSIKNGLNGSYSDSGLHSY
jgi:TP901 family phage tail tape measure protein